MAKRHLPPADLAAITGDMMLRVLPWLALPIVLASCVAPRTPPPAPAPPARPQAPAAPIAPPAPTAERYAGDWSTADATPGDWRYVAASGGTSLARFTAPDGAALAELACTAGTLSLTRTGVVPQDIGAFINVRSSFAERRLPVQSADQSARRLIARLPARDPLWDQLIYSRGRFVLEATRQAPVILPNRAEVARVIEDCRG